MKKHVNVYFWIVVALSIVILPSLIYAVSIYCGVEDTDGDSVASSSTVLTSGTINCQAVWTINCSEIGWYKKYYWTDDPAQWVQGSTTSDATHYHPNRTAYGNRDSIDVHYCSCIYENNTCTQNSDCCSGYFCNSTSKCAALLADGTTCVGATNLSTSAEENVSCSSGYCDNDGVGAADDNHCFSVASTYYDDQDGNTCEYSAYNDMNTTADEKTPNACDGSSGWVNNSCYYFNDGDSNETVCDCIAGSSLWNLGGEVSATSCCSDDASELNLSTLADESTMENSFADNTSDDACCSASTDCIASSTCYNTGTTSGDADSDGDNDYCNSGEWTDCNDDTGCSGSTVCSQALKDCVNADGYIVIRNLGTTGLEQTNQEYTSSQSVYLEINFTDDVQNCKYTNYPNNSELPAEGYDGWTPAEPCITSKIWLLSNGTGLKYVFLNLNYTDRNSTFNDSIYFNYTGAGLDTTGPTLPVVYHNNYTNNNQSIVINWYNSSDPESTVLGIALQYNVILYNSSGGILGDITTTEVTYTFTGFNFPHNTTLYANVSAINSAGMKNNATSSALIIDLDTPTMSRLNGSLKNISSNTYLSITDLPNEDTWVYAALANFSWAATDDTSGISAYSYILTTNANTDPDTVPEGSIGSLHNEISKSYTGLTSDKYYFYIKAKDLAGNWGNILSVNFSIDNSPASKPEILTETKSATNIDYTWSASTDSESGITMYMINLTDENEVVNMSANITDTSVRNYTFSGVSTGNFNATVGVLNGVGIWRWSNQEDIITDFDPPTIYATPNRTVVTNTPIIKAWTNEQATCNYNSSPTNTEFKYSNTTYHETKLSFLSNGHYTYVITCTDPYDNSATFNINFTVNSNLYPDTTGSVATLNTFKKLLTTFTLNLLDSAVETSGVTNDMFKLYLDNVEKEVSVFDLGDSYYNVTFEAPDSVDNYTLRITINETLDKNITLIVKDLYFTGLYEDAFITSAPETTNHITYFTSGRRIGFASDSDINLNNYVMAANELNITGVDLNKSLFIFNTKIKVSMADRENRIDDNEFLTEINPSFGYPITEDYIVNYVLRYDEYALLTDFGQELSNGRHNLFILRTISDDDTNIKFTKSKGTQDRIVLTSN